MNQGDSSAIEEQERYFCAAGDTRLTQVSFYTKSTKTAESDKIDKTVEANIVNVASCTSLLS